MNQMAVVTWLEVEAAATQAFSVWVDQPELAWAKLAWDVIIKAGLADYHENDDIERCTVAIRFLSLCGIYLDFNRYAWDEDILREYAEWAEVLGIPPFRVGQLVGLDPGYADEWDATSLFVNGLTDLANQSRKDVVDTLLLDLGGTTGLFLSLWRSHDGAPSDWTDEERANWSPLTDEEILNHDISEKGPAFGWVLNGCPAKSPPALLLFYARFDIPPEQATIG